MKRERERERQSRKKKFFQVFVGCEFLGFIFFLFFWLFNNSTYSLQKKELVLRQRKNFLEENLDGANKANREARTDGQKGPSRRSSVSPCVSCFSFLSSTSCEEKEIYIERLRQSNAFENSLDARVYHGQRDRSLVFEG